MGAGAFHGRVRDGIGCSVPAEATGPPGRTPVQEETEADLVEEDRPTDHRPIDPRRGGRRSAVVAVVGERASERGWVMVLAARPGAGDAVVPSLVRRRRRRRRHHWRQRQRRRRRNRSTGTLSGD